jgi:predicted ATPase
MLTFWKEHRSQAFNEVKQALIKLELASDISAQVELGEFLKLLIRPSGRGFSDTIADVGFGVSQILPMLVADAAMPLNGTLLVNQPEIHLHPSSQALIADYLSERIDRRQYVIETHSEYLINRLRLLVAKGVLKEDDVKIYYCSNVSGSGQKGVTEVRVRRDGVLEGMPGDFFTTYATDTYRLAMAVMDNDDATE